MIQLPLWSKLKGRQADLPPELKTRNSEESYENVESILSLAHVGYRRLLSLHYERLACGLAAISWTEQKRNVAGERSLALLA